METQTSCNPQAIKDQVKRTEGQVLGVGRMVEGGRTCADVLQQIVAARASLQKLGIIILEAKAQGCFGKDGSPTKLKDLEQVVSQLFKIT
jgi:DNA-binding FrmR family transcriptional regulator